MFENTFVPLIEWVCLCYLSMVNFVWEQDKTFNTLNESLFVTGLIAAACERTVEPATKRLKGNLPMSKAQNGNGFKSSAGTINGVQPNGNGVHVDEDC